jgi:3-oxoacyl-[acyl-carrier protein] reductase
MKLEFSGKNALILGGSCEIGILLGQLMILSGLFPLMTFRSPEGEKRIASALQPVSDQYASGFLDFAQPASIDDFFSRNTGELHYLVDLIHGDLEQLVASRFSRNIGRFYEENVSMRAKVLEIVSRRMLGQKFGRLVYVSSTAAARPHPGQGFYASSKLASEAIYKNLGLELGGKNITTVVLRPGYIDVGRGRSYAASRRKEILEKIPIKRLLSAGEVAETIMFLISDSARGLNATEIVLDGGLCAGK